MSNIDAIEIQNALLEPFRYISNTIYEALTLTAEKCDKAIKKIEKENKK